MRYSQTLIKTQKENPTGCDTIAMKYMVKSGMIKKVSSGLFTYLPYYNMMMQNVARIIKAGMTEMNCAEVKFPILVSSEDLAVTNRWNAYGKEMFKLKDRNEKEYALSPTNEEASCILASEYISSYKDLPFSVYQIQQKHRDEIRPRGGVVRAREFVMKDAYSFHADEKEFGNYFKEMKKTYLNIFKRIGLNVTAVKADSGPIGGNGSEEIMAISDEGESEIVVCQHCNYGANLETVPTVKIERPTTLLKGKLSTLNTPNTSTIADLMNKYNLKKEQIVKTLVYIADGKPVLAMLRGDRTLCDTKLKNYLKCTNLDMATEDEIKRIGSVLGFVGPVGLAKNIKVVADYEVLKLQNFVVGANKRDYHLVNVNLGDFDAEYTDLRNVERGDVCPVCGKPIDIRYGTELGHIFDCGKRYTKDFNLTYVDRENKNQLVHMGCYGIGLDRTIASVIDQYHDEKGMLLPFSVAPFVANIIIVDKNKTEQVELAESIYKKLSKHGLSVLLDDRDQRAGSKFADHELLGIPVKITVGRTAIENKVECQLYRKEALVLNANDVAKFLDKCMKENI